MNRHLSKGLIAQEQGLARYLKDINQFPMLSLEEEQTLAQRWTDAHDKEAAHKLVTSHLRLVAKIAMRYKNYGLTMGDVIAEGNFGLMRAVRSFDPQRGFRLATYAMWWIHAAIKEYILRSWSLVKIGTTAAQKKLFFNLARCKERLGLDPQKGLAPASAGSIANAMAVNDNDVLDMDKRLLSPEMSLNTPMTTDESSMQWQDSLVDENADHVSVFMDKQEHQERRGIMRKALMQLSEREQLILLQRRLREQPITLEALAGDLGISCERVRQIEKRAFEKLQKYALSMVDTIDVSALYG